MKLRNLLLFAAVSPALSACGAQVVFGEDDGGGNGGASTSSATGPTGPGPTGPGTGTTMSGPAQTANTAVVGSTTSVMPGCDLGVPPPMSCDEGCFILYQCGVAFCDGQQLCPGFSGTPGEQMLFHGGCLQGCADQPAILALLDPSNCDVTISTIEAASTDFANVCQFGF